MSFAFSVRAQGYLQFTGNVTYAYTDTAIVKCKIQVFVQDSLQINGAYTDAAGNYSFSIPLIKSKYFFVKLSYPGCVAKYYSIGADIPTDQLGTKFPEIQADLSLNKKIEGVDYSFLNKPLNHYYYNKELDNYTYDSVLLNKSLALLEDLKKREEEQKKLNATKVISVPDSSSIAKKEGVLKTKKGKSLSPTVIFISIGLLVFLLATILKIYIRKKNDDIKRDL
jgi:hypothetical protein